MSQKTAMRQARHNAYVTRQNAASAARRARFQANQTRMSAKAVREGADIQYTADMFQIASSSLQSFYTTNDYSWEWKT